MRKEIMWSYVEKMGNSDNLKLKMDQINRRVNNDLSELSRDPSLFDERYRKDSDRYAIEIKLVNDFIYDDYLCRSVVYRLHDK